MSRTTHIPLTEYKTKSLGADELREEDAAALYKAFGNQVDVQWPSPRTKGRWELRSLGYVGHLPVSDTLQIRLEPKVTNLHNLFRMLEYAFNLDFKTFDDVTDCDSLDEFFERLANILARRVLDRARKGLYRTYVSEENQLPYVRGRWDIRRAMNQPWSTRLNCEYQDHTADNEDNQLIAWTLRAIIRSGLCGEKVLPTVRRAYRVLQGKTTLIPFESKACRGRLYHRLNLDYRPTHALCRFFLDHTGPTHQTGDSRVLPFLVNMARLYESFVARWLAENTPGGLRLKIQEKVDIHPEQGLQFAIDLVLKNPTTNVAEYVLDTKYKVHDKPQASDIEQIVAYAEAMHCREAVLVYPVDMTLPLDRMIGRIRVRSLAFRLDGDLEDAGAKFVSALSRQGETCKSSSW